VLRRAGQEINVLQQSSHSPQQAMETGQPHSAMVERAGERFAPEYVRIAVQCVRQETK
jgi:hypothetical protein